jgi:CPA1 family monovalent cation:H+ antiporter
LQGLTLPYVIQVIGLPKFEDHLPEEDAHKKIKKELFNHSTKLIQEKYGEKIKEKKELYQLLQKWQESNDDLPLNFTPEKKILYLELLHKQRELLISLNNDEHNMDEDIIRKYLHKIDLEEEKIKLE